MAEEVRARVVNWLRATPALPVHRDEETASEDELEPYRRRKRALKSGKIRTVDTLVTGKITCPHEVVYNSQGQPDVYDDMSTALFANGYPSVLGEECNEVNGYMLAHLQEVMEDADVYSGKCVRSYHVAWLQQIEQGRVSLGKEARQINLRIPLVWNRAPIISKSAPNTSTMACLPPRLLRASPGMLIAAIL